MSSWDERAGRVTRSFDEWQLADREQRAFLRIGLRLVSESCQRLWDEVGSRPSDGEDDLVEAFEREVEVFGIRSTPGCIARRS